MRAVSGGWRAGRSRPHRSVALAGTGVLALVALAACRSGDRAAPTDRIPALTLGAPTLVIGGAADAEERRLLQPGPAVRTTDGDLVVVEGGVELHRFSPDGTLRWAIGGPGEGPEDFQPIQRLTPTPAGGLVVKDGHVRARITIIDRDGDVVRRRAITVKEILYPCFGGTGQEFPRPDGGLAIYLYEVSGPECPQFTAGIGRVRAMLRLVGPDGTEAALLGPFLGRDRDGTISLRFGQDSWSGSGGIESPSARRERTRSASSHSPEVRWARSPSPSPVLLSTKR